MLKGDEGAAGEWSRVRCGMGGWRDEEAWILRNPGRSFPYADTWGYDSNPARITWRSSREEQDVYLGRF